MFISFILFEVERIVLTQPFVSFFYHAALWFFLLTLSSFRSSIAAPSSSPSQSSSLESSTKSIYKRQISSPSGEKMKNISMKNISMAPKPPSGQPLYKINTEYKPSSIFSKFSKQNSTSYKKQDSDISFR